MAEGRLGPPREEEAGATCGACGLCGNRKKTLEAIFGRLATLLGQDGAITSPTILKEMKQAVNNGQYIVAQLRPHAPALDNSVPTPTQEKLRNLPLNDFRGVGRAGPWGVAAPMYSGGGRRATHWRPPSERRPGDPDFSRARVDSPVHNPLSPLYPLGPSSYSDSEEEHEGEDRLERVE